VGLMPARFPPRFPFGTAFLSAASLVVACTASEAALELSRGAAASEPWRLVTGHVAHFGRNHLAWDLVVFAGLGAIVERRSRAAFLVVTFGSACAIAIAILAAMPEIERYRGLSGVDSALAVYLATHFLVAAENRAPAARVVAAAALGGFFLKTAWEAATGATLFVDHTSAGFVPLPLAHLVGGAVGGAVALACALTRLRRGRRSEAENGAMNMERATRSGRSSPMSPLHSLLQNSPSTRPVTGSMSTSTNDGRAGKPGIVRIEPTIG
jgi:rhomboid family GlyGly-CTERM serine protease